MKIKVHLLIATLLVFITAWNTRPENARFQLIVFEGSDWCLNCRRLERSVLSDPGFATYLYNNQIQLVRVDFPQGIKQSKKLRFQNDSIAEQYNFQGIFPTLVLTDLSGSDYAEFYYSDERLTDFTQLVSDRMTEVE